MEKTLHFVAGLPRSGSTLIQNIVRQNPSVDSAPVSGLCTVFNSVFMHWDDVEANKEYPNEQAKRDVLESVLHGYHKSSQKPIVFDKDRMWVARIGLLEEILQKKVKILVCVRNPAEIITSFERIRKNNPLKTTLTDYNLSVKSTIASRAFFYASPDGPLGLAHALLKDACFSGYLDRFLFVDYNKFCNSPRNQLQRIYDFFELPRFEHDLINIQQDEVYNSMLAEKLPDLHKIRPKVGKVTVNCVEFLGLDLYEQYNREIFWNAWI